MPEIELSVMNHSPESSAMLRSLLDEFERRSGIRVQLKTLEWVNAKTELNRIATYHQGPDVSEVGTTWVSDLISMNALRSFQQHEVARIGRPDEFVPTSWETSHLMAEQLAWAVPWLSETYIIYYRKDLLRQAGVDEAGAFTSHARLAETAESLKDSGVSIPAELSFEWDQFGILHALASWVWASGGDFCSPDGRHVTFQEPEALKAIQAYFDLLRYISPEGARAMLEAPVNLYQKGQSGIMFSTLSNTTNPADFAPGVLENTGAAVLPGARFAGGSNLVVWRHSRHEEAAIELVRFLTEAGTLLRLIRPFRALPSRLSALEMPEIMNHPILRVAAESVKDGRSYPRVALWGLVEDRLIRVLIQISLYYISNPTTDLNQLVSHQIDALARRLNITLAQ